MADQTESQVPDEQALKQALEAQLQAMLLSKPDFKVFRSTESPGFDVLNDVAEYTLPCSTEVDDGIKAVIDSDGVIESRFPLEVITVYNGRELSRSILMKHQILAYPGLMYIVNLPDRAQLYCFWIEQGNNKMLAQVVNQLRNLDIR
jgi:hypothetical protein